MAKTKESNNYIDFEATEPMLTPNQKATYEHLAKYNKKVKGVVQEIAVDEISNYLLVLKYDDHYKSIRYNEISKRIEIERDGVVKNWNEFELAETLNYFEQIYRIGSKAKLKDAILIKASEDRYNPLVEKMRSTTWDGKPHVENFLIDVMGCEKSAYSREVSRLMFSGIVNRALKPGCKFDYCPILYGKQGSAKSTLTRWLAMEDKYHASIVAIDKTEQVEVLMGKLVAELEELEAFRTAKGQGQLKSYISSNIDTRRLRKTTNAGDFQRTNIFIGTTNETCILQDTTGARRFLPIEVKADGRKIFEKEADIKAEIMQCYAEMVDAVDKGLPLANTVVDIEVEAEISEKHEEFECEDWRIGPIKDYVNSHKRVCIPEIREVVLHKDIGSYNPQESRDIGNILVAKCGCQRGKKERFGKYGEAKSFYAADVDMKEWRANMYEMKAA